MDTLVLSVGYEPMDRISWQRAMMLWASGKVEIVEEYEDRQIRTVRIDLRMPSVVRLLRYIPRRKSRVRFSRHNVYARDKGRCQYCGIKMYQHESTYDHVVPRSQGGTTCWENVVLACFNCNQKKANRTPKEARMRLYNEPVRPKTLPETWRYSFTFQKDMPPSWRQYMTDFTYWNSELDQDNT
ncbi:MAG TPA: HNH endonuclease [Myxococcales bacterium]|nr:HNH endonuclease [Deltaproteobacteria bacterium]MBU50239.1 HNH endonuclease [Deltaproteobacteria bacterium]HAA55094.1 HNH endonuclease [Myxococcales bacterium]|tara:strand:- start:9687 stop:10238 length:552 start_codon:yes stop_codon:yes gene_type:complete